MKPTEDDIVRARLLVSDRDNSAVSTEEMVRRVAQALFDERERVIELLRPEYTDLIPLLRARARGDNR